MMHKFLLFFVLIVFSCQSLFSQNNLPYPVIFVHGLAGSDQTFGGTMEYLRDNDNLGEINVFDVVLNADNDTEEALMATDVRWTDFYYSGDFINVGRRNYKSDIDDFVDGWTASNIFAINFKEERIRGAAGFWNDYFDQSNESAIFKQGYALSKMIQEVLDYTGAEKVILVGHSMGGLCIREYLQRTNSAGTHVNWIDPSSPDGHKVARVATYGTPHLGSNTSPDPTKSNVPSFTGNSEANRDLLWEYDSYNYCSGTAQGIYMFGGNEHCIESEGGWFGNETFDNVDINCNGSQNDNIVGINEDFYSYTYNSAMPLPLNIKYTYLTSIYADWGGSLVGDGAVNINRQWLHNGNTPTPVGLADTALNDIDHLSEGGDYEYVIRGIDEPHRFDLAYTLQLNRPIIGYVTYQQNRETADVDVFKINCTGHNAIAITIDESLSGVHTIGFYDAYENMLCSRSVSTFPNKLYVNVPNNATEIYIKISGTATNDTWKNPYTLNVLSGSWLGDVSVDWNNSNNWQVGEADEFDDVFIPSTASYLPTVDSDEDCNRLRIPVGASLTINSTASVNIHNNLTLNGKIILKSDLINTASYLDNGNIDGTGTVKLERNLKSGGYHYLSAHISNGNADDYIDLDCGQTNSNFFLYDETINNSDWSYGWQFATGIMETGRGYAYYAPYEQSFFVSEGIPNTGDLSISVSNSNYGITSDGWNLVGNPYPSAISATDFINLNNSGVIQGAVYLWDDDYSQIYSSEDYGVFNLAGYVKGTGGGKLFGQYIAPGQGFYVKALNNGTVNFQNSIRAVNNSVFFKKNNQNEINRLYINFSSNEYNNNILLAFAEQATESFDLLYDALKLKINGNFSFYSILEDKDLITQTLPKYYDDSYVVKLGVEVAESGDYTFSFGDLSDFPDNMKIFFIDSELNEFVDIYKQDKYIVNLDANIYKNRFSVVFTKNVLEMYDYNLNNPIEIYAHEHKIHFKTNSHEYLNVKIYNSLGKLIISEDNFSSSNFIELGKYEIGVYLVKVVSDNFVITRKVILN